MKTALHRGVDLVHQLLELETEKSQAQAVKKETVSTTVIMDKVRDEFTPLAREKEIALNVIGDGFQFESSYGHLMRILANLVSNAIKFSPRASQVQVKVEQHAGLAVFKVMDEGPGFTEKDKQFLFAKLKRLSARPTAGKSSHGLGLALVKVLVDQLGGKIALESSAGVGARFRVEISI